MLKKLLFIFFFLYCLTGVFYLALPDYEFPLPPPDSIQSQEPSDTETPLRRGYYTNYSRQEVLDWYKMQFEKSGFLGLSMPTPLLNYPPEYAESIIRDQTSSSFLQEYTHPLRESIYINGFKPQTEGSKPAFVVNGEERSQKIIIRVVSGNIWVRETLFLLSAFMLAIIYNTFIRLLGKRP